MQIFELATLIGLGFVLGLRHALDADHVAAVSTIVREQRTIKDSSRIGMLWGAGHTATLLAAAVAVLGFKLSLPPAFEKYAELAVGFMLVILGIRAIHKIRKTRTHYHTHEHDEVTHAHFHSHAASAESAKAPITIGAKADETSPAHEHGHVPFLVGMIHGLAGSAPLILLAASAARSALEGILYMVIFGLGSVLGMFAISGGMGLLLKRVSRFTGLDKSFQMTVGAVSVVIGFFIILGIIA